MLSPHSSRAYPVRRFHPSNLNQTKAMTIRHFLCICPVLLLSLAASIQSLAAEKPEKEAQIAAEQWLALIDAGQYAESWQSAAGAFQSAVPQSQWQSSLEAVRKPLGSLVSRKLKSAKYTKTLPGAPDGEYVILQFDTSFANKKEAVETITPMLDADKKWKVSGYFIK
jgi:hypothetical protein